MRSKSILIPAILALGISTLLLAGCIQFGPGGTQVNNTNTQNTTINKAQLSWIQAPEIASKFDKIKSYFESMVGKGNVTFSNFEKEKTTGIMRSTLGINGQEIKVYLAPDLKHFWAESGMKKLTPGQKVEDFLKSILKPGVSYTPLGEEREYGLEKHNYKLEYMGREVNFSLYKLGDWVIPPNVIQEVFSPEKTQIPKVDLYIMAFCPYGRMAASLMYPVEKLLGDKANITVHYVIYPSDMYSGQEDRYCLGSYCSMHGINETKEDVRQLCIEKYYPNKFWDYLHEISSNFSYSPASIESKWQSVAEKYGINTTKIEKCAKDEGQSLLENEFKLDQEYGVNASPTLIINGQVWKGGRSANAFKWAICQAFKNEPEECQEEINQETNQTPAGSCG